jgi:copper chaperone CopZ
MMCCHHEAASQSTFDSICSIVLGMLLIYSLLIRPRLHQHRHAHASASAVKQYRIEGMMCSHCQAKVEQGIGALEGVTSVTVDLDKGLASVEGAVSAEAVAKAVNALGYDFAGEVEDLKEGL